MSQATPGPFPRVCLRHGTPPLWACFLVHEMGTTMAPLGGVFGELEVGGAPSSVGRQGSTLDCFSAGRQRTRERQLLAYRFPVS